MAAADSRSLVAVDPTEANKEKYTCVVRDETHSGSDHHSTTFSIAFDAFVSYLCAETANRLSYEEKTFLLVWEKPSNDEVVLDWESTQNLKDLGLGGKLNRFIVREKDGNPPVKIKHPIQESSQNSDTSQTKTSATSTARTAYNSNNNYSETTYATVTAWDEPTTGYVGLVNQAMTCYLNSLLQSLYMTPEFRNALYGWKPEPQEEEEEEKNIPLQLQKLFVQLQTSGKRSVETTDVTRSFGWDSSEAWQQHDVQELCRVMFDALEQKWTRTDKANLINQLYQGKMQDYVKCHNCGYESVREATYLDIALDIKPFGAKKTCESVEEALEVFITPETLNGTNQYYCDKCEKKCDADKGLKFMSFPYLLTLQLKRFEFDYQTLGRIKLNDKMTFPDCLNLNKFLSRKGQDAPALARIKRTQSMREDDGHVEITDDKDQGNEKDQDLDQASDSAAAAAAAAAAARVGADSVTENCSRDPNNAAAATSASPVVSFSDTSPFVGDDTAAAENNDDDQAVAKGPFFYELFSIMVHSGSAIGGHYYAYIKSFADGKWFCFNDQSVTSASWEDIKKKTFGGIDQSSSYYYSSAYSSSANAYMLMYRQKNDDSPFERDFLTSEDFPTHIRRMQDRVKEKEEHEKKQKEIDKSLCKLKLYCHHPKAKKPRDNKFEIHEGKTLKEATEDAWKLLVLDEHVPLECCRLIRYDDFYESLDQSYDETEELLPVGKLFGGPKSFYQFDLLLETKESGDVFKTYKRGGVTLKVHLVDLDDETVSESRIIRANASETVSEVTKAVATTFNVPHEKMRLCFEASFRDVIPLNSPEREIKSEGFYKVGRMFAEAKGEEDAKPFIDSKLFKIASEYVNSIQLSVQYHYVDEDDEDVNEKEAGERKSGVKHFKVRVDRRMTMQKFKQDKMSSLIGLEPENFRVYRCYGNNQEYEVVRLDDTMTMFPEDGAVVIRPGRALKAGELRVKIHSFTLNEPEPMKFMFDWIIVKGRKVADYKRELAKELERRKIDAPLERLRLRKKSWQSPGTVFLDDHVFTDDVQLYNNFDMLYEILPEPEPMKSPNQLSLYVRRWRPSTLTLDPLEELIIDFSSPKKLKEKISLLSEIPLDQVEFAKGRGYFPCDVSVLEIQEDMNWNPTVTSLNAWPLYIHDDGVVVFYRDRTEKAMELSDERRKEIQKEETAKYAKATGRYHRKEKALKIYTESSSRQSPAPAPSSPPSSANNAKST
ncbi:ubiquitin carboxyl-terminal hydrolase 47-like isoform X2 [Oscarella lobularis]|uniref:ubiquitin carboxyl-terminal hydrolase 47-like isoform X2 n=1 Tax=Oscarella lobularis TaxID=121494 RepID=UPI0033133D7D